jgi:hypothetical protein
MNPNRNGLNEVFPVELVLLVTGFGISAVLFVAAWLY